jgi:hypothetical protein
VGSGGAVSTALASPLPSPPLGGDLARPDPRKDRRVGINRAEKLDPPATPGSLVGSHGRHNRQVEQRASCRHRGLGPRTVRLVWLGGRQVLISPGPRALCSEQAIQGGQKEKHKLVRAMPISPISARRERPSFVPIGALKKVCLQLHCTAATAEGTGATGQSGILPNGRIPR